MESVAVSAVSSSFSTSSPTAATSLAAISLAASFADSSSSAGPARTSSSRAAVLGVLAGSVPPALGDPDPSPPRSLPLPRVSSTSPRPSSSSVSSAPAKLFLFLRSDGTLVIVRLAPAARFCTPPRCCCCCICCLFFPAKRALSHPFFFLPAPFATVAGSGVFSNCSGSSFLFLSLKCILFSAFSSSCSKLLATFLSDDRSNAAGGNALFAAMDSTMDRR
mmetsp:Transcript_36795/g.78443  ORF Transcript_36795/g.78443 Transcript_36795/m.78443 type:complete len:220 (-) Transcript_36795:602-1261(-)